MEIRREGRQSEASSSNSGKAPTCACDPGNSFLRLLSTHPQSMRRDSCLCRRHTGCRKAWGHGPPSRTAAYGSPPADGKRDGWRIIGDAIVRWKTEPPVPSYWAGDHSGGLALIRWLHLAEGESMRWKAAWWGSPGIQLRRRLARRVRQHMTCPQDSGIRTVKPAIRAPLLATRWIDATVLAQRVGWRSPRRGGNPKCCRGGVLAFTVDHGPDVPVPDSQ